MTPPPMKDNKYLSVIDKKKWPQSQGCRETEYRFSFLCNCHKIRLIGPLQMSAWPFMFKKSVGMYTPLFFCSLRCAAARILHLYLPLLPPPWLLCELEVLEVLANIFDAVSHLAGNGVSVCIFHFLFLFSDDLRLKGGECGAQAAFTLAASV